MIKKGKAYYLDNEELNKFSSILNKLLSKKYDWFKRLELESVRYQPTILNKGDDSTPLGKIYVDKEWGENQWNKKWGSSFEDELGEIMFSDMLDFNLRYEIQNIFKLVFSSVVDVPYPRYTPFTWISVHPADDKNNLQEQIRRVLKEDLESKWNTGNKHGNKYDYQHGYCHYFAYDIIGKLKKLYPKKNIRYYLILADEVYYDDSVEQSYLIHAYIKIDDLYLDSNGFSSEDEIDERAEQWYQRQLHQLPEDYELNMWHDEYNEIPQHFFNNSFCNTGSVKRDVERFLSHPEVRELLKMNIKEHITKVLKEETSQQTKIRDLIESKGIDLVSTIFGGFEKVAEILNLDVEDVDTQEWLVKNFIYHADFDEVDVSFIVAKTLSSGRRLLTVYFNSDSNASNIASWYVSEVCDYLNKELFPFKVNAPWRPNFIGNDLKIVLDGEVLDDDNEEELTEKWSAKYKRSINCNHPKGFSQKAHCAGRRKEMKEEELTEKCWKGYTQKGMKTMFGKRYPNCVKKTKK